MGLSSGAFLTRECFVNIRRNGLMSVAALGIVTMALAVLGASLWAGQRVREIADQQPHKFNQIDVFLNDDAPRSESLAVGSRLLALPGVKSARLVTREQAWKTLAADNPALNAELPYNPLPDKYEIQTRSASDVAGVARAVRDRSTFPEIAQVNDAVVEVRTLLGFARVIRVIGGATAIGLFVATFLIVYNTIRLTVAARRREIHIMQLVGATPGFIRFPLLLEGVVYGVVGAIIAAGIVLFCGYEVSEFVAALQSPLVGDTPAQFGPQQVAVAMVVVGAGLGLVGSYFSMRRFLKQV